MKTYNFGPGRYNVHQLADELVVAGVPMGGAAYIGRDGFPIAIMISVVANDDAVDATVNSTVADHVPVADDLLDTGLSTDSKPPALPGRSFMTSDTGQLFENDGLTWTPVSQHVQVVSLSDFPAPVSGIITLQDRHAYQINGTVDIGTNRIVCGIANIITGIDRTNDKIVSTTTGALFTCDSSSVVKTIFTIQNITVECATGSFINLTSTAANQSLVIISCTLTGFTSFGTIHNASSIVARNTLFTGSTVGGFTCTSTETGVQFVVRDCVSINCAGTLFSLGTSVFQSVLFGGNRLTVNASQTFLSGTIGGANVTVAGKLTGNIFSGAGTYVGTITAQDVGWFWDSNTSTIDSGLTGVF